MMMMIMMMMMMMMMTIDEHDRLLMMNCFCGIVDRRKALTLISSRDNYQSFSPSQTSDTLRAGFELPQNQFRLYWRKLCNSDSYCITCEKHVNSFQITCLNLPWRFQYMDILPKQHWLVPRTDSKYGKKHIKSDHVL